MASGQRLAAINAAAQACGLHAGMRLADARAIKPDLHTHPADAKADRRLLERLANWCDRYTPWVALDEADAAAGTSGMALLLDISGCAHLFGAGHDPHGDDNERRLVEDLTRRLADLGFACRAAVADSAGAAWAACRFAETSDALCIAPSGQRAALAGLPVAGLRLTPEIVEGLHRLGLRRIGDLYSVARAPLANRFGALPLLRLDQALGRVEESIAPRRPAPPFRTRLAFAEPIGRVEDIEAAAHRLLAALCRQMEGAGLGARRLELTAFRVDGSLARAAIGTSRPQRDAAHLLKLFAQSLPQIEAGFGIELMILAAPIVEAYRHDQGGLPQTGEAGGAGGSLAELVDRLTARLGEKGVIRPQPRFSHLPERAVRMASASSAMAAPADWRQFAALRRIRPVQMLAMPEPIDVTAPVPDDPPLLFRWRQATHRIAKAEGPERLANEWWHQEGLPAEIARAIPKVRDYYRVEDDAGRRFWIYRDGPLNAFAGPGPARATRWYLHGFCA